MGRALYGRVDWNRQEHQKSRAEYIVALFTGAWIEITLKPLFFITYLVALFTGAWIEIGTRCQSLAYHSRSRALYGRVDWNRVLLAFLSVSSRRALYGRVDWNATQKYMHKKQAESRSLRARGLKWINRHIQRNWWRRRALYGRVDWNRKLDRRAQAAPRVALFTGAWIEIKDLQVYIRKQSVALFTGAWIEITIR